MKPLVDLPFHYFRARWFSASCVCMAVFSLTAVVTFQLTAFSVSQWSEYIWKAASPASPSGFQLLSSQTTDGNILQLCSARQKRAGKFNQLDIAKLEALCTQEQLLIKIRKELNELDNASLQRFTSSQKILDPLTRGFSEGKNNEMMKRINELQQIIDGMRELVRNSVTFLPLKDMRFQSKPEAGHTWFMSSFDESIEDGNGFLRLPSNASKQRILCVKGRDHSDGTKNGYGLAWRDYLPPNSTLLHGLTFVAENYWDYGNLWHGLMALGPFVLWNNNNESVMPKRIVLYHKGEVVHGMVSWISEVLHSVMGYKLPLDILDYGNGPICFEQSLVYRHSFGSLSQQKRSEAFDVIRSKARAFCNITIATNRNDTPDFNFTLLTRAGARSFKNESVVSSIFENECSKIRGCQFRNIRANGLSFCDQVSFLSTTHVLVTVHGAQLTNMIFMPKGSHIMEIFPKGWLEFAGIGQYVFHWLADWAGMKHEGTWRDTEGPECLRPEKERLECFSIYKNGQVGYNQTALSRWSADVLKKASSSISAASDTS
ncbi:uncharacterized protein LOC116267421 [Nymphaea colorata]|nr:uncharacterized protein LOC116267421 [Nymphaea colorata]